MRISRIMPLWIMAICMTASLLILTGCDDPDEEIVAPLRQVKSMVVTGGDGAQEQSFSGRLHSTSEVGFSFKVAGTIEQLPVQVGDQVRKGDVLARIDPADYELQVERAEAALAESEAALRNAKANYARVKKLYEAGNVARTTLDQARAEFDTATAGVQANGKALEIARKDLSYTILRADADCAIATVIPDVGENVAGGTTIIDAACGDGLEVKLNIPESVISHIAKDMGVTVHFSAIEDRGFEGVVSKVGVSSVGAGTTFPVDVLITDRDQSALKAGLSAVVTFAIDVTKKGDVVPIIVPPFAVGADEQGQFVYTLMVTSGDVATVRRTAVEIGAVSQDGVEIRSGVLPNMRIVVAGLTVLREGMEVRIVD